VDRLASEWRRLYAASADDAAALVDTQGHVRCMVLSLGRPADWPLLKGVWQTVQTELSLPAPGIAVSGTDSYQLWFSLAEPVPAAQACAFLTVLCERLLGDVPAWRLLLWPALQAGVDAGVGIDATASTAKATPTVRHAAPIPAPTAQSDQWSAFVAPDLAPVFADTPWLDIPPNAEGQAELLARLHPITPTQWREAVAHWPITAPTLDTAAAPPQASEPETVATGPLPLPAPDAALNAPGLDPRAFLQRVMHDPSVPLALRIEAAKALLAHEAPAPAPASLPTPPCP
jgi:hypothetical protein